MNWYYWKKTGLNMLLFWKNVGKIYIIPSIMCIVVLFMSYRINFYKISYLCLGIVIYTCIYCLLNWRFVFSIYEKNLIKEPINKIKKI